MPFDNFFSSKNKKHYIPYPGAEELADKLLAMPFHEREATIESWRKRGFTLLEHIALKRLRFLRRGHRWALVRRDIEKRCEKATKELEQGKRVFRVVSTGWNTASGASHKRQAHSFGGK